MLSYTIKIADIYKNKIGYISFIYNEKTKKIYISYLNIYNEYKNKGYGTLLILFSIKYLIENIYNSYFIKEIKLDDCSDYSGTPNSIYYKVGFRNYDIKNEEQLFIKFFNNKINRINNLNIKNIYDLYDYIKNNNFDKLNTINYNLILFKIIIFNNSKFIKIKEIKFNLNKKIIKNLRITRRSKLLI